MKRVVPGLLRVVGFVVLGVWAATTFARTEPVYPEGIDRSSSISQALANYRENEANADSSPQQDVVNGWVARDLLEVIAGTVNDMNTRSTSSVEEADQRLALLVTIAVLALCWHGLTLPFVRPTGPVAPTVVTVAAPAVPAAVPAAPVPTPAPPDAPPTPQSTFAPPPQPPQPPTGDGARSAQWPAR